MIEKTENALKNLIEAYKYYEERRLELTLNIPRDLFSRMSEDEKNKLRALFGEFNSKRLQKSEDAVRIAAADFVKFFNEHGL